MPFVLIRCFDFFNSPPTPLEKNRNGKNKIFGNSMKNLSAKNNEEKNDFSASLRPFGTHNSRYLQGLRHILLRYRYGERQISANVSGYITTDRAKQKVHIFQTQKIK